MKKLLISLSLVILLITSMPFCAFANDYEFVVDNGNLLTDEEEAKLETELDEVFSETGLCPVVLTVSSLEGKTAEAYADDYYDNADDYYDNNAYPEDGCLLLVRVSDVAGDSDWHLSTKGEAINKINDANIEELGNACVPKLKSGDYYGAFHEYGNLVVKFSNKAKTATFKSIAISFIIALIIAFIVIMSVKKSYKPVQFNRSAANYLVDGSLQVTQGYEHFLYANVTKTARSDDSNGSSTHTSSSGSTHGGGGGKF
ncbi:MAG: TPM domain-containing protein [Eubacterium sp.]|nr:TPM domain-containing protein [Eubacterium sp.]